MPTITLPQTFLSNLPIPDDAFLRQCIHCGLCLSTCPTYALTSREISSPRGRIRMMKNVAEGTMPLTETFMHEMFFCLDCRACETACPAGVQYGALVEAARAQVEHARALQTGKSSHFKEFILSQIFAKPARLRLVARLLRFYQWSGLEKLALRLRLPRIFGRRVSKLSLPSRACRKECRLGIGKCAIASLCSLAVCRMWRLLQSMRIRQPCLLQMVAK
jgi:heterodisulfide reductase subunit C